ncbi:zinc finger and SCAN domain-containing protein 21-like isoform X3 [Ahaetulla prasina]|uniref:zinc finger and SCAN domain-containing protein 21-like isoform X3 n=1 Tax=Ahaetulla prasina TaxID=499056 RepID=UPI0026489FC6|nr:zinc finger and SCAN domain-containing protein 21-like isoform X3 [Ahaetulla prasina]
MNEPRPAGTDQEPGGTEKNTSGVHHQRKAEQLRWGVSQHYQRETCHGMQELWEAQLQQFLKSLQPILTGRGNSGMSEASPWEDTKEFLASFEQVAKACRWPRDRWAAHLLPALSGEAEEAFRGLEARDQENYEKVKAAILRGEALRTERQRQHFRQFCCQVVEDPRRIHSQLQELCRQWLKPERRTKEQILELLILEQFLASLPPELRSWIQARRPESCSQAVALVEDFLMSQQEAKTRTSQDSRDFKETGGSLQIVKQGLTQPGLQQTMLWQVLQEADDTANRDNLGNEMGNYIKVEISQDGETEREDACRMEPQTSYNHVPVKGKRLGGRSEPQGASPQGGAEKGCIELAGVHRKRYQRTPLLHSFPREGGHGVPKPPSSKPPSLKKPRTSPEHSVVWNHFELDSEDPCYGICTHCKRRISRGKNSKRFSTSGLLKHLQRHHANFVPAVITAPQTALPTSRKAKGPVLPQCWTKKKSAGKRQAGPKPSEVTRAVDQMVALDDQPFRMVEDAGFQHLLELLAPKYKIPSGATFSRQIVPSLYQACREEALGMLQTPAPPASVDVSSDD